MLFKHSIRSLLLLAITAASASAQSPLWFERNSPAISPSAAPSKPPVTAQGSQQPTWIAEIPSDSKALPPAPKSPAGIELNNVASWQGEGDAKLGRDREVEANQKSEEAIVDSMPDEADSSRQAKFNVASMVGPMANAQMLFSMLEVAEDFHAYAEPVHSMRTRDLDSQMQAAFTSECYTWISPVFYHKPLYFEQPNLERYGNGTLCCLQPVASSVHFFGSIPLLPYKLLTQHPCEKYYTLGNRRPGNYNPVQKCVILGQSHLGEVREYWRPGSGY